MNNRAVPPLVEAFLIIEQPRQRVSHWVQALAPLDDGRAPPLAAVTAYYEPSCDQALLGLRYDELALGRERLAFVIEIALLAEVGMIQPAELTDGDRRRFLGERLARCTLHVADQRSVVGSLTELVRWIREQKLAPRPYLGPMPMRAPGAPPVPNKPRGTTENPVLLVHPKGTRDDLVPRSKLASATPPPLPRATRRDEFVRATSPHLLPRTHAVEATLARPAPIPSSSSAYLPMDGPRA
ncbi:MAG: hypothetical protein WKG01_03415 [Kofleriaceae bacterium]